MSDATPEDASIAPLPEGVLAIDGPIQNSEQLESAERLQRLADESWALRKVIEAWTEQRRLERALRKRYANVVLATLLAEIAFAATVLILIGADTITLDKWVANVFFAAVFAQIAAGAHAILKYLFPPGYIDDPLELLRIQKGLQKSAPRRKRGK
jgi:hypothetical protein